MIPADGFYEWQTEGKKKQPYYFRRSKEGLVFLAGLWARWTSPAGDQIESCTIITTEANTVVHPVHHRMPVIIPEDEIDRWPDPAHQDLELVKKFLVPCPEDYLIAFPVSTQVNNPRNDEAICIEQLAVA